MKPISIGAKLALLGWVFGAMGPAGQAWAKELNPEKYSSYDKYMLCADMGDFPGDFSVTANAMAHGMKVATPAQISPIVEQLAALCDPKNDQTPDAEHLLETLVEKCMGLCGQQTADGDAADACRSGCGYAEKANRMKLRGYRQGKKDIEKCQSGLEQIKQLASQNKEAVSSALSKQIQEIIGASSNGAGFAAPAR
jgi:hypothetical protein